MKIIEGMKRLRVIEKRMDSQRRAITEYASKLTTEMPRFQTKEDQAREVASLIQSNNDLFAEYLRIKRSIEYTNLKVTLELQKSVYTISDLLVIRRKLADMMVATYRALNDDMAQHRLRNTPRYDGETPKVETLYDEREKLENIRKWQDLSDMIDSRLEVVNATTDLIEME
ncbi:MAG: hypothetical protein QM441_04110 [Synergistota bacterium]|mgnify:FL=1|jgi:hypothetical protein|nr:hypothetical protein [Synergistota bacterium]